MNGMTAAEQPGTTPAAGVPMVTAATSMEKAAEAQGVSSTAGLHGVAWHISTRSADNGGSCVEAGPLSDGSGRVAVRHSHAPNEAVIVYTRAEWAAFVGGVKDGEFDF